jgi:4-alpha-glucanotransferase
VSFAVRRRRRARSTFAYLGTPQTPGTWRVTLTLEGGERHVVDGTYAGVSSLSLEVLSDLPTGYHRVDVELSSGTRQWNNEQTLIVVPDTCWSPADALGDASVFGLIANLYTIRSDANWGVGDLSDLAALAEWGGAVGADFVGVNPLHALLNRGTDVSPYSPVSRLFRNPIYIDVMRVPELRNASELADRMTSAEFAAELDALRETPAVRYEQVMGVKGLALDALHRVFLARVRGSGDERDREYDDYRSANEPALTRFATWMAIAESGCGYDWRVWPSEFRHPESATVLQFARDHASRVDFHRWAQFELDRQLGEAAAGRAGGGDAHWTVRRSGHRNLSSGRRHLGVPRAVRPRCERWCSPGSVRGLRTELGPAADRAASAPR